MIFSLKFIQFFAALDILRELKKLVSIFLDDIEWKIPLRIFSSHFQPATNFKGSYKHLCIVCPSLRMYVLHELSLLTFSKWILVLALHENQNKDTNFPFALASEIMNRSNSYLCVWKLLITANFSNYCLCVHGFGLACDVMGCVSVCVLNEETYALCNKMLSFLLAPNCGRHVLFVKWLCKSDACISRYLVDGFFRRVFKQVHLPECT